MQRRRRESGLAEGQDQEQPQQPRGHCHRRQLCSWQLHRQRWVCRPRPRRSTESRGHSIRDNGGLESVGNTQANREWLWTGSRSMEHGSRGCQKLSYCGGWDWWLLLRTFLVLGPWPQSRMQSPPRSPEERTGNGNEVKKGVPKKVNLPTACRPFF